MKFKGEIDFKENGNWNIDGDIYVTS